MGLAIDNTVLAEQLRAWAAATSRSLSGRRGVDGQGVRG